MIPTISVITAVYNGENCLENAIESVLSQTYQDFEMIIVNDASTDRTSEILKKYSSNKKIIALNNNTNKERSYSRNRAIHQAKGLYVAILDADDICMPDRFEKQIDFLEKNQSIDVLGGNIKLIDNDNNDLGKSSDFPFEHADIVWESFFETRFAHSTVMMRRDKIIEVGGYREHLIVVEDTDLWLRLIQSGSRMANLSDVLVKYRTNERQMKSARENYPKSMLLRKKFLDQVLERELSIEEYYTVRKISKGDPKLRFSPDRMIFFSHIVSSALTGLLQSCLITNADFELLSRKVANNLVYIANRTEDMNPDLLITPLKELSTKDWIKYYWECKKGYLRLK